MVVSKDSRKDPETHCTKLYRNAGEDGLAPKRKKSKVAKRSKHIKEKSRTTV